MKLIDHFKSQHEINVIDITFGQLIPMISILPLFGEDQGKIPH